MLAFLLAAALQTTPVAPLPKGTGLPPPVREEDAVMAPIAVLMGAIERSDGAAALSVTRADGGATAAIEAADGRRMVHRLSWAEFAGYLKPGGPHYRERLTDPAIEIDGDVAMVWAPYIVFKDGTPDHCGYDHFDLVREAGAWKILNVTWSQRTTGCVAG